MPARPPTSFRSDASGVSAVEFGLVLPVLMMIVMAAIEFGLILFTFNTSEHAARNVVRQLATNRLTTDQAPEKAKAQLPGWAKANATVEVTQTTPGMPSTNVFAVRITIPAKKATITSFLSWAYSDTTLESKAAFQQEVSL